MERIQVAPDFYLDEFIDPYTYFNTEDRGLSLLDVRLFGIVQTLRNFYGYPIYINNWWTLYLKYKDDKKITDIVSRIELENKKGNVNIWSGIRTERCSIGAKNSAHKMFKAIDPKGNEKRFFRIVKENLQLFYDLGIRRLEDIRITKGWMHIDTLERNTKKDSIRVVGRVKHVETLYFTRK